MRPNLGAVVELSFRHSSGCDPQTLTNQKKSEATVPSTIRVIHAHDFVKATPEGWLDRHQSMKLLRDIASVASELTDFCILLDTRKAQSGMNETDLWYLSSELQNHFQDLSRSPKVAVLCPRERFNKAEFFALCANNRGFDISAFTEFEGAYEWLIESDGRRGAGTRDG